MWIHTLLAVDQAVPLLEGLDAPRALAVMLGVLCHDLGKPATTRLLEGRLRSHGHEEAGLAPTAALLDRWNVHSLHGYDVRGQVLGLVGNHLKPGQLYDDRERVSDGAIRRLAAEVRARAALSRGARRLPGPDGRLPAGGDGVVPGPRARARGGGAAPGRAAAWGGTCSSWASRPGPRWAASCAPSTSGSSTAR